MLHLHCKTDVESHTPDQDATENSTVLGVDLGVADLAVVSTGTFNGLYEYVEYKAAEYGIDVEQVDPANTSRRCSHCGFTHPENRDGDSFECLKCNYQNHADYNAAKNTGLRDLRRNQTGDGGRVLDNRRLLACH
jgi:transposase